MVLATIIVLILLYIFSCFYLAFKKPNLKDSFIFELYTLPLNAVAFIFVFPFYYAEKAKLRKYELEKNKKG